jgi:hypothetical protein
MAEHLRQQLPGPSADVVSPYTAMGAKLGTNSDRSLVVMELRTVEGIPLSVGMARDLASIMAIGLRRLLEKPFKERNSRS